MFHVERTYFIHIARFELGEPSPVRGRLPLRDLTGSTRLASFRLHRNPDCRVVPVIRKAVLLVVHQVARIGHVCEYDLRIEQLDHRAGGDGKLRANPRIAVEHRGAEEHFADRAARAERGALKHTAADPETLAAEAG